MQDENKVYELEYPAPEVNGAAEGPTLIIALQGYADAGHAVEQAANHLKDALDSRTVASFNNDELIDYRSRRPSVTLDDDHISSTAQLNLDMRVLKDSSGTPFLLLSGPEPDFKWESFTQAVADLADKYQVSNTVALYGSPMQVPHTRPLMILAHGNSSDVVGKMATWDARVTVPGSAALYIERELHERGHTVGGYTAQVPHYLAQSPNPDAAFQLLNAVQDNTGLVFPLGSLEADIDRFNQQLTEVVATNPEMLRVVQALEENYDREIEKFREKHPDKQLPGEGRLPTGEEIGAEFEAFLASMDRSLEPGDEEDNSEDKDSDTQ